MSIEMSPDLAEVCGIHAGDGYLRNDGKRREFDISGGFEEKDYYDNHVAPLFEKVFGLTVKPRPFNSRSTYGFVIRDKKVIEFMHSLGFPYGKKTLTVAIPKQILHSDNFELLYRFIKGVFDTDGCLSFNRKPGKSYTIFKRTRDYYPRISIKIVSQNLFNGLKTLLDRTGFYYHTKVTAPQNPSWNKNYYLCLSGVSNLEKWVQNIGFKNPSKFSRYLIWKQYGFCPRRTTYEQRKQILNKEIDPNTLYKDP